MEKQEETSAFIGQLAMALYEYGVIIHFDTLQKVLDKRGVYCENGVNIEKVVAAACRYWKNKDPVIHHAIAHAFIGQNEAIKEFSRV